MMRNILLVAVFVIVSAISTAGTWLPDIHNFDPLSGLFNDGILIEAANLGDSAQSVTVGGITFDTDTSHTNAAYLQSSTAVFYTGDDADIQNLFNNSSLATTIPEARTISITIPELSIGSKYRLQVLIGGTGYRAIDAYTTGWDDYSWSSVDNGTLLKTYEWLATSVTKPIYVGLNWDTHIWQCGDDLNILAYALHDITPPDSDITGDGSTNIDDLAVLASYWLSSCEPNDWCENSDINHSGQTDMSDFSLLSAGWQKPSEEGLVAFWPMDEGSGSTLYDQVHQSHGTLYNMESQDWVAVGDGFVIGPDSRAEADNLGEYGSLPMVIQDDFTIAFWLRTTATADDGQHWSSGKGLIDADAEGLQNDFGISLTGNKAAFGVGLAGISDFTIKSSTSINDGYWHHIAAARDSDTGQMTLYVDGAAEASGTGSTGPKNAQDRILVGSLNLKPAQYLAGWFDDIKIYNRLLSAEEIEIQAINPYPSLTAKRGFGMVATRWPGDDWKASLTSLNPSWFYTWGTSILEDGDVSQKPDGVEFAPMKWGPWGDFDAMVVHLTNLKEIGVANYVMGFNEPDSSSQADMTVAEAIGYWPYLMQPGTPLVSPGCVHADSQWMQDFMAQAQALDYPVDYVAVHWYGGASADSLLNHLQSIYNLYGLPIWISEFGVADWSADWPNSPNRYSPEQIYTVMAEMLWRLEKKSYIKRYAWFSAAPDLYTPLGTSSLFEDNWTTLTPLGKMYAAFDGDVDGPDTEASYYLNNEGSWKRLVTPDGSGLEMAAIYDMNEDVQWKLISAGDGWYFIENKAFATRLRYDPGSEELSLVNNSNISDDVQWNLTESEHGWYRIGHKATDKILHYRDDWGYVGVVNPIWDDGNVRWRFIKP